MTDFTSNLCWVVEGGKIVAVHLCNDIQADKGDMLMGKLVHLPACASMRWAASGGWSGGKQRTSPSRMLRRKMAACARERASASAAFAAANSSCKHGRWLIAVPSCKCNS